MNLIENIRKALEHNSTIGTPERYCPNCWGRQEYGGHLFETIHKEKIDLSNLNEKKGWIQEYAAKHLSPIKLQKSGDNYVCQKCTLQLRIPQSGTKPTKTEF